jgi:hypothetical protein
MGQHNYVGTETLLGQVSVNATSSDVINLKIVGNTISCYWNRTQTNIQYNDSSPVTGVGYAGL